MRFPVLVLLFVLAAPGPTNAQVFGTVRVVARDQQNLALSNADASIKAAASSWTQTARTDALGEAVFPAVPAGHYANPREATVQVRYKFNY